MRARYTIAQGKRLCVGAQSEFLADEIRTGQIANARKQQDGDSVVAEHESKETMRGTTEAASKARSGPTAGPEDMTQHLRRDREQGLIEMRDEEIGRKVINGARRGGKNETTRQAGIGMRILRAEQGEIEAIAILLGCTRERIRHDRTLLKHGFGLLAQVVINLTDSGISGDGNRPCATLPTSNGLGRITDQAGKDLARHFARFPKNQENILSEREHGLVERLSLEADRKEKITTGGRVKD